jgi:hypothetical protein
VVNADAVAQPAFEVLAVGAVEFHADEVVGDGGFFVLGQEVEDGATRKKHPFRLASPFIRFS